MKAVDSAARAEFIKVFLWLCPFIAVIGLALWGIFGLVAGLLVSIVATKLFVSFTGGVGGLFGGLFSGRRPIYSREERYEGDLNQARFHKMNKHYDKALEIINAVVDQEPDFPEALFLKAQILCEGFEDITAAKVCLQKVTAVVTDKDATIYRWASNLYEELLNKENN
jgi:hypothetical protein